MGYLGLPSSGAWLNVIPWPGMGLHLQPSEFFTAIKYRMGINLFPFEGKCTACPLLSDTAKYQAGGKDIALDITVVNPLQTAFINQSAEENGKQPGKNKRG